MKLTEKQRLENTLKNAIKSGNKSKAAWAIVKLERLENELKLEQKKAIEKKEKSFFGRHLNVKDLEPKILGITDEVSSCFCCGKSNLKRTVVFKVKEDSQEMENNTPLFGEYRFLGSHCAKSVFAAARTKLDTSNIAVPIKVSEMRDIQLSANFMGKGQVKFTYHWQSGAVTMTAVNGEIIDRLTNEKIKEIWQRLNWTGEVETFIERVENECKRRDKNFTLA